MSKLGVLLLAVYTACGADCRSECEKRGGRVVAVDCHDEDQTQMMLIGFDVSGNPQYMWTNETVTVCAHVCQGAR